MKIESANLYDLTSLGLPRSSCDIYVMHVKIDDINDRAQEIIDTISETSWIKKLGVVQQAAYTARVKKTIDKLVNDILSKVDGVVTADFGEYLISDSAGIVLADQYGHTRIPLSELWKEKSSGNPGFDFHTVSLTNLIAYGEAKYTSSASPYTAALDQIGRFITDKKDEMDFIYLQDLVSKDAMDNALNNKRGYIAAFSLDAKKADTIFANALKSVEAKALFNNSELYLIGIEICS